MLSPVSHLRRGRRRLAQFDDHRFVLACVAFTLLLRLPFVNVPLGIDEGGYAYVAAHWGDGAGGIYGAQWVDRPPLLIGLYAASLQIAGDIGVRLMGCLAAAVVVVACADAVGRVAGPRGLRWSGAVAAVLASSTVTQANTVNAELPAIAFTSLAAWCTVRAITTPIEGHRVRWGVAAGIAAMGGVLVKQSFVDGYAFAIVALIVWGSCARRADGSGLRVAGARVLAAGLLGSALALSATVAWAELWGPGMGSLLNALYSFRLLARAAIDASPRAPETRFLYLFAVTALTGMVFLIAVVAAGAARLAVGSLADVDASRRGAVRALAAGLLAMGALGLFGIVMGGNWWLHYLTQLGPFIAMGVGLIAATPARSSRAASTRVAWGVRRWAGVLVATTLLTWCITLYWSVVTGPQRTPNAVGDWLRAAARPNDTALVTWGHANILHRSGLRTPYRMAWSLPVRVQDPHLDELDRIMRGRDAPTWIVEWRPISSWGLDPTGRVRTTLWRRYERMPDVCGKVIYRLRSNAPATVPLAPTDACNSGRGLSIRDVRLF